MSAFFHLAPCKRAPQLGQCCSAYTGRGKLIEVAEYERPFPIGVNKKGVFLLGVAEYERGFPIGANKIIGCFPFGCDRI